LRGKCCSARHNVNIHISRITIRIAAEIVMDAIVANNSSLHAIKEAQIMEQTAAETRNDASQHNDLHPAHSGKLTLTDHTLNKMPFQCLS
jgi:hypothetical protein